MREKWCSKYMLLLFSIFLISCNGNLKKQPEDKLTLLKIEWDEVVDKLDYSFMVEDSVLIIPLETKDECLIGEVTKLIYQNDLIYIADNMSKSVFVFDLSGKLVSKIHAVGNGPGEYVNITCFTVHGTDMIIYDHYISRLFFYNASGEFIRDKDISDIWGEDLFCMGDKLYLPNSSHSKSGYNHLYTIDLSNSDEYGMYLPFIEPKDNAGWGVESYHTKLKDEALIYHWPYDTLYTVRDKEAFPSYVIDFGDRLLPKQYVEMDGITAMTTANRDDYIKGIDAIKQSEKYLFLQFSDANNCYIAISEKETSDMLVGKIVTNKFLGNLLLQPDGERFTLQDEKIIQCYPASFWSDAGRDYYANNELLFYSEKVRRKFIEISQMDESDVNPIVLIQNLKK